MFFEIFSQHTHQIGSLTETEKMLRFKLSTKKKTMLKLTKKIVIHRIIILINFVIDKSLVALKSIFN